MNTAVTYGIYFAPLLLILLMFTRRRSLMERQSAATWHEAAEAGLTQPASLHPVVDPLKCIGCESCVNICPEFPKHQVLGIIGNKAELVSPTDCIGHGLCKTVCPEGAISLVFGTAERGVEIPHVNQDFSTNIDGVYIAGELGGMGLIRNAIEQGRQALCHIRDNLADNPKVSDVDEALDLVIIGAGPAGIAATLGAMEAGVKHITIEQNALGGTVANFPRGKLVMTAPAELPLVGSVRFAETTKEELVGFWQKVQKDTSMQIQCNERLIGVERTDNGTLLAKTDRGEYLTRALLLAIGRRGTPRTLGVPGEELTKVAYAMVDPGQYQNQDVLVVGGGDAALEAACSIADESGARVTLSYRGDAFGRAKKKNRERIEEAAARGTVNVLLGSQVSTIEQDKVLLTQSETLLELPNHAVIICAGGILPTWLLENIGITMETKYGTA